MAVDTADKRSSAINIASPWRSKLPFPNGTIDQPDRQHVAFMYRGIAASAGGGGGGGGVAKYWMGTTPTFMKGT